MLPLERRGDGIGHQVGCAGQAHFPASAGPARAARRPAAVAETLSTVTGDTPVTDGGGEVHESPDCGQAHAGGRGGRWSWRSRHRCSASVRVRGTTGLPVPVRERTGQVQPHPHVVRVIRGQHVEHALAAAVTARRRRPRRHRPTPGERAVHPNGAGCRSSARRTGRCSRECMILGSDYDRPPACDRRRAVDSDGGAGSCSE